MIQDVQAQLRAGQLETILATIPAGVMITDSHGRIVGANARASEIWGGKPPPCESVEAYTQFKGWWPDSGEPLRAQDWAPARALLAGETIEGEMVDIERFDGRTATILNSAAPLLDEHGEIAGAVAVMQDVTEQRDRQKNNELLLEALGSLSGSLELSEVLDRLVRVVLRTGSHTRAAVLMWNEADASLEVAALAGESTTTVGTRIRLADMSSVMRGAVQNRRKALTELASVPPHERGLAAVHGIEWTLIVPLERAGRLLGVVAVDEMRAGESFTQQEVEVIEGIAAQAALAIDNARLYEAQHHIAVTLQQALLSVPETLSRIDYAHAYRSASEEAFVGGDFYDLFEIGPDLIGILMGDIAGKGLEAAVLTQLVKNTVRAHAAEKGSSPATILKLTNDIFYQSTGSESFATVFFGVLHRGSGRLTYTNAGHTTAFIARRNGALAELPADSPLLGAFPDRFFTQSTDVLEPHAVLVLYTDGVTEARSGQRQFGEERLERSIRRPAARRPPDIVQAIVEDVLAFTDGSLNDDLAVLAVERLADTRETPHEQRLEVSAGA